MLRKDWNWAILSKASALKYQKQGFNHNISDFNAKLWLGCQGYRQIDVLTFFSSPKKNDIFVCLRLQSIFCKIISNLHMHI